MLLHKKLDVPIMMLLNTPWCQRCQARNVHGSGASVVRQRLSFGKKTIGAEAGANYLTRETKLRHELHRRSFWNPSKLVTKEGLIVLAFMRSNVSDVKHVFFFSRVPGLRESVAFYMARSCPHAVQWVFGCDHSGAIACFGCGLKRNSIRYLHPC